MSIVDLAEAELALKNSDLGVTAANWAFHRALYQAAGWDSGLAMVEIPHAAGRSYVLLYIEILGGAEPSEAEHEAILAACRSNDVDSAIALLRIHLADSSAAVIGFLSANGTTEDAGDE